MRPAAGLQRDIDRRQLGKEPDQILPPQVPSQDHTTCPSTPCSVKTDLDVSIATRVISFMDGSWFSFDSELWHQMPRGRPPQRMQSAILAIAGAQPCRAEGGANGEVSPWNCAVHARRRRIASALLLLPTTFRNRRRASRGSARPRGAAGARTAELRGRPARRGSGGRICRRDQRRRGCRPRRCW